MTSYMEIENMQKPLAAPAIVALCALLVAGAVAPAHAQFNSGSTGVHGVFPPVPEGGMPSDAFYVVWNVKTGLVRYCSVYTLNTGAEQCDPSAGTNVTAQIPNIPIGGLTDGVYHFTDVNIPAVNGSRFVVPVGYSPNVPLSILSQGDIMIQGGASAGVHLHLNGGLGKGPAGTVPGFSVIGGKSGPGGFDGGASGNGSDTPSNGNAGFGPKGGSGGVAAGAALVDLYGRVATAHPLNPSLTPLSGGSGGGGAAGIAAGTLGCEANIVGYAGGSGGGGGGALLLAASGRVTIAANSFLHLYGGNGGANVNTICRLYGGGGSGGSVRIVGQEVTGGGTLFMGGGLRGDGQVRAPGGFVRIESAFNTYTGSVDAASAGSFLSFPTAPVPANQPVLRISSLGGASAPGNPSAQLATPDITFAEAVVTPVTLGVSASNVPLGTQVQIKVVPAIGEPTAATTTGLTGTLADSTAQATVTLPPGAGIVTATATFNISGGGGSLAFNALPLIDGERPTQMEVVALGDGSSRTYLVSKSGARFEVGVALR